MKFGMLAALAALTMLALPTVVLADFSDVEGLATQAECNSRPDNDITLTYIDYAVNRDRDEPGFYNGDGDGSYTRCLDGERQVVDMANPPVRVAQEPRMPDGYVACLRGGLDGSRPEHYYGARETDGCA